MPRSDIVAASPGSHGGQDQTTVGRRRAVVGVTLVVGTASLAGILAAPSGSALFFGLGLATAVTWIAGAVLSGPVPWRRARAGPARPVDLVGPIALGAALFAAFLAAKVVADHVPVLSHSVASVLARADTGPRILVLVVALVNGLGEEVFFRGAVADAFGGSHPALWSTAVYCVVTMATLNLALVAAALAMGAVFSAERRATGGVVAPILTHLSWSALVILFFPR